MTGTTPACAVCKYQRRKCSPACPLAPYFPANQTQMFQNVHRLYGVSNVTKILDSLDTKDQKDDAMRSIIYEAEMRERFPVHGCSAVITQLRFQLHTSVEELRSLYLQIAACKEQLLTATTTYSTYLDDPLYLDDEIVNHNHTAITLESIQAQMNAFGLQESEESKESIQAQMNAFGIQEQEESKVMNAFGIQIREAEESKGMNVFGIQEPEESKGIYFREDP